MKYVGACITGSDGDLVGDSLSTLQSNYPLLVYYQLPYDIGFRIVKPYVAPTHADFKLSRFRWNLRIFKEYVLDTLIVKAFLSKQFKPD